MISENEAEEIKEKLISHIESTFSPEQADSAINQINSMNLEQLENFLVKNNLVKNSEEESEDETGNCIFCAIASEKINSVKIDENENAVAVLDINPVSRGHVLVIPKTHGNAEGREIMSLAKKISKKLKEKFSPRNVEIVKSKMFGHEVINVIPVYENENLRSKRKSARTDELEEIKEELEKEIPKKEPKIIERMDEFSWLPKRIP